MAKFKPMVKMMTTEPSVELKLKKGGKVERKMQMGGMADMPAQMPAQMPPEPSMPAPMPAGMPATGGMMPTRSPRRPSLAARRRAMKAMPGGAAPAAPIGMAARMAEADMRPMPMKKGGDAMKALKAHKAKPASKAHAGLKTGGVVMGQGGYKEGGRAKKTGGVVMGKAAGYATGGVAMSNAGGYRKGGDVRYLKGQGAMTESERREPLGGQGGMTEAERRALMGRGSPMSDQGSMTEAERRALMGRGSPMSDQGSMTESERMELLEKFDQKKKKGGAAKKAYAAGGIVDSGAPVAMPQGRKKPTPPVAIDQLAGTFKKGGEVKLQKAFKKENAPAMKAAKAYSNEVYSKYGKKMANGGDAKSDRKSQEQMMQEGVPSDIADTLVDARNRRDYEEFMKMQSGEGSKSVVRDIMERFRNLFSKNGSVTKTEETVTVKKRKGGKVGC